MGRGVADSSSMSIQDSSSITGRSRRPFSRSMSILWCASTLGCLLSGAGFGFSELFDKTGRLHENTHHDSSSSSEESLSVDRLVLIFFLVFFIMTAICLLTTCMTAVNYIAYKRKQGQLTDESPLLDDPLDSSEEKRSLWRPWRG